MNIVTFFEDYLCPECPGKNDGDRCPCPAMDEAVSLRGMLEYRETLPVEQRSPCVTVTLEL